MFKKRILELNASDDRGISVGAQCWRRCCQHGLIAFHEQVIREKVKTFACRTVGSEKAAYVEFAPPPALTRTANAPVPDFAQRLPVPAIQDHYFGRSGFHDHGRPVGVASDDGAVLKSHPLLLDL